MSTRFLVCKHVPDLTRMEPRNIGVILWSNGVLHSRFLGTNGTVHVPSWIRPEDKVAYREWIAFWQLQISRGKIKRRADGATIEASSPDFLDVLKEKSKPQFMLAEGGILRDVLSSAEIPEALEELFDRIVEKEEREAAEKRPIAILKARSVKMFKRTRLMNPTYERPRRDLLGRVFGVQKYFDADFAFGVDDRVVTAFTRVLPGIGNTTSIATLMFQGLREISNDRLGYRVCALVSHDLSTGPQAQFDLEILRKAGGLVLDVSDEDAPHLAEEIVGITDNRAVNQAV